MYLFGWRGKPMTTSSSVVIRKKETQLVTVSYALHTWWIPCPLYNKLLPSSFSACIPEVERSRSVAFDGWVGKEQQPPRPPHPDLIQYKVRKLLIYKMQLFFFSSKHKCGVFTIIEVAGFHSHVYLSNLHCRYYFCRQQNKNWRWFASSRILVKLAFR